MNVNEDNYRRGDERGAEVLSQDLNSQDVHTWMKILGITVFEF